jgi:hypothetical protein
VAKLFLLSIIFATIALPARAARIKNSRVGLKRTVVSLALFNLFYVLGLVYLYHRLH